MHKVTLMLVATAALAGCGARPPDSRFPTGDDALGRMHACYDCALGVQGTAKIDHLSPKGRVKGDLDFMAVVPAKVRFEAEKFGVMIYSLTSDGKNFKLLDTQQKQFLFGPAKPCNLAKLTQVPVPGHVLVNLLRGEAPVLVHDASTIRIEWDTGGYYRVLIDSKNDAHEEIHLKVRSEDYEKPWSEQRVLVTNVRVAKGLTDLYAVDLSDFEAAHTSAPRIDEDGIDPPVPPSGPPCDAEIPHEIHLEVPNTLDDVLFKYKDVKWNPPLIDGAFTQPVPGGVEQIPTDCADE